MDSQTSTRRSTEVGWARARHRGGIGGRPLMASLRDGEKDLRRTWWLRVCVCACVRVCVYVCERARLLVEKGSGGGRQSFCGSVRSMPSRYASEGRSKELSTGRGSGSYRRPKGRAIRCWCWCSNRHAMGWCLAAIDGFGARSQGSTHKIYRGQSAQVCSERPRF